MNDTIRFTALLALCFSMLAGTSPANELQDRLNQSVAGDVVEVSPGVYEGALTIPDGVILWGAGAGQTILDGAGADVVVSMGKDSVLGGVTIQNGKTGVNNQGNYIGVFESELTGLTRAGIWLQNGSAVIANNRFMGRDYVTLREEVYDGETVWVETSVGRARLASAPARVSHIGSDYRIVGAAWGAPIDRVEVKIDDGPWMLATIDPSEEAEFAWKIWSLDWPDPPAGVHAVSSRAIDTSCNVQPAMDDPSIATKHTYWESNGQVTRRVQIS